MWFWVCRDGIGFMRNLGYIILSKFISCNTFPKGRHNMKHNQTYYRILTSETQLGNWRKNKRPRVKNLASGLLG